MFQIPFIFLYDALFVYHKTFFALPFSFFMLRFSKMFQKPFTNQRHAHYQHFGQITKFCLMFILGLFVHTTTNTIKIHANLPFTVAVNNLTKNVNSVCTECVVKLRRETGNGRMCC